MQMLVDTPDVEAAGIGIDHGPLRASPGRHADHLRFVFRQRGFAEETNRARFRDPAYPDAVGGLVYEVFFNPADPTVVEVACS